MYTVHWNVNDGRNGYPNITADLSWTDQAAASYEDAIRRHASIKNVRFVGDSDYSPIEITRGRINGINYRDYKVFYLPRDAKDRSVILSKEIRIFCKKYRKAKS